MDRGAPGRRRREGFQRKLVELVGRDLGLRRRRHGRAENLNKADRRKQQEDSTHRALTWKQ